jgi:type IV secretion system protein VirD4
MSGTRILWGQVLLVGAIALLFVWAATQWTAWRLGFQAELGPPMGELLGWPVYPPPAFFVWWYWYDAYAPQVFMEGAYIASAGGFVSIAVAMAMSVWRAREAKDVSTYGSARWATRDDLAAAGLLGSDGVVLGKHLNAYLRHDGPEHVLCYAPTRSGKGVGLVVPTLLTWPGSCVVHDIKGENWTLTAGWRARFGRVVLFDPTNAASSAYNPYWRCGVAPPKSATSRTLRTSWSIPRARSKSGTTGRRPATRFWSARSSTSSTPKRTKRSLASLPSSPIPNARSRRRCAP